MVVSLRDQCRRVLGLFLLSSLLTVAMLAQSLGTIRGVVTDSSGAAIPGTTVTASGPGGAVKVGSTNETGAYTITGVTPGKYTVRVLSKGFGNFEQAVEVGAGRAVDVNATLTVALEKQEITVTEQARVDVDPSNNAGALVLKGADLDSLSDNPDDMQADLQALAGPAAGPNGGQIYIDGFTGGRLPPKESIREIRVNQNPFSAEFDRLGFGRIEIFTKPGTDKYHGQAFFSYGNSIFNSRNPFALTRPDYQARQFDANFGGPISKKSSFFIDAERRMDEPVALINATILGADYSVQPFIQSLITPVTRTTVSPRIDYQLSTNNTLTARYTFSDSSRENQGVSQFTLPGRQYNSDNTEHTVQLTETAVLNARTINETRFQYIRRRNDQDPLSTAVGPTISVQDAFTSGGSPFLGEQFINEDRYELQNYTSITHGTHLTKFGVRVRSVIQNNQTTNNYNGTYLFTSRPAAAGAAALTSLDVYRITQQGLAAGLSFDQIRALGGGPAYFTLSGGNPLIGINQTDLGFFVQDDWRLKPNVTLSLGLRYETQTNIHDWTDFAPRIAIAWGIGGGKNRGAPKLVIRTGTGIFYDRFTEDYTLNALQQNGINQLTYTIANPTTYPNVPDLSSLPANTSTIRRVDQNLHAPYMIQSVFGVEKQLPKNITLSANYTNTRGVHQLRSRNINAPLPGTYDPNVIGSGIIPYYGQGPLYDYESSGIFNQNQLTVNSSARINTKINVFGFYALSYAKSNTDGAGSFAANQYDFSNEYGRAGFDTRHRAVIGGRIATRFGLSFSPFINASSGLPFNIYTGNDLNGDNIINDRPAFATDLTRPSVRITPYGAFDIRPMAGQTIIPRNYAEGPGRFSVNLRLSRTWGWGERGTSAAQQAAAAAGGGGPDMARMAAGGGGPRGGGGGGGRGGGGGGPRGGGGGMFGEGGGNKKYNLTFSASARNLFNHVNYAQPVGNLSAPNFGQSRDIAGGFGPSSSSANRSLELQLRFQF